MDRQKLHHIGLLVLRVSIAGLMLFHGVDKLSGGIGGLEKLVASKGLPKVFAYGVYIGEVVAPLFILIGYLTRPAALVFAFNMLAATFLAHSGDILRLDSHGAWATEHTMLFFFPAIAIALLGAGKYSVSGGEGTWD